MFELFMFICIIIFLVVIGSFIPIGNENSTVRRLPWVTFGIMGFCVFIYYATLPAQAVNVTLDCRPTKSSLQVTGRLALQDPAKTSRTVS